MMNAKIKPVGQPFWDRIARRYARQPVRDETAYQRKLTYVSELLQPSDRVLELGCGTGSTALRLAPLVAQYTATDGSSEMIEIAKDKAAGAPDLSLDFVQADAMRAPNTHLYDAVLAFSLLHLVEDLSGTIGAIENHLIAGGVFVSKTHILKDGPIWLRAMVWLLGKVGLAPHVSHLSLKDLRAAIESAGFQIADVRFFGAKTAGCFITAMKADTGSRERPSLPSTKKDNLDA